MNLLKEALGSLAAPVVEYLKRRAELKQARFEAQLKFEQAMGDRRAELIKAGLAADAQWEMAFANQAASSWKDEYTLFVVSVPLILAFFGFEDQVSAGFASFSGTPIWYQVMVQTLFYATVGIRLWRREQSDT